MYTNYFGFNEKPFTLTPNPRFIYLSRNHREALAHLIYGINNHYGFIELIGEVGSGKTTVLRTVLEQLGDREYRSALIFNPCLTGVELLRSINHEFGLNATSEYTGELLTELNSFLLLENARGVTVVLVIDEAQNLSPEILEQLRLISNLETENDKLIQIVLAGQPELARLLALPALRQLNQRIAVRYWLKSMNREETDGYIRHRMSVAGETGGVSFSRLSLILIYFYSNGLPRLINNLCDRSLLIGYGDERRVISPPMVLKATTEICSTAWVRRMAMAVTTVIILGTITFFLMTKSIDIGREERAISAKIPDTASIKSSAVMGNASSVTSTNNRRRQLRLELLAIDQDTVHHRAFNAIAHAWGVKPVRDYEGHLTVPVMFSRLAAKRNLQLTEFKGGLADVLRFKMPFLVKTTIADWPTCLHCLQKKTLTLGI